MGTRREVDGFRAIWLCVWDSANKLACWIFVQVSARWLWPFIALRIQEWTVSWALVEFARQGSWCGATRSETLRPENLTLARAFLQRLLRTAPLFALRLSEIYVMLLHTAFLQASQICHRGPRGPTDWSSFGGRFASHVQKCRQYFRVAYPFAMPGCPQDVKQAILHPASNKPERLVMQSSKSSGTWPTATEAGCSSWRSTEHTSCRKHDGHGQKFP